MSIITKSKRAKSDLAEIWSYIADDSETRADSFIDSVEKTLNTLAQTPLIGRSRQELAKYLYSFPIGNYIVFYRVIADGIVIIRVLHGSRDIDIKFFADDEG